MTLDLGHLILKGKEVMLRPLEQADAAALAEAAGESREHYGYSNIPDQLQGVEAYIDLAFKMKATGERYPFTVIFNGRIVGSTSYYDFQPWRWPAEHAHKRRTDRPDVLEMGYTWLAASAQRTRCNTESKFLLMQQAFDVWQVYRVFLRTDERNRRSRAAIERLGCKLDGIRRADMAGRDGSVRNSAFYSLLADEWPAAKARLLQFLQR